MFCITRCQSSHRRGEEEEEEENEYKVEVVIVNFQQILIVCSTIVLLVTKWFPQEVEKQLSSSSGKSFDKVLTFKEERTSIVKYPLLNFDKDIIPPIPSLLFLSKVKHENLSRLWNWQLAWEMMCCVSQEFCADKQISQEWKYGDMSRKFSVFLANVYSNSRCTKNFLNEYISAFPSPVFQIGWTLGTFEHSSRSLWLQSIKCLSPPSRISDPDQARMYLTNTRLVMPWNLPTNQSNSTLSSYQVPLPIDIIVH